MKVAERLFNKIDSLREYAVNCLCRIIGLNAVNPAYGGPGELRRAEYIEKQLEEIGVSEIKRYDFPDERAEGGIRPNIVAKIPGKSKKILWIISHMDTVPPGDLSKWQSDPFKPLVAGDKIYGRGAEDNGQAIVSSLLAAKAILEENLEPEITLGLVFAADEEAGSRYGVVELLKKGIFSREDLILVPDAGSPKGDFIEIAEKSILWLKITTKGVQSHSSMPHRGLNAHRIGMKYALMLDEILHQKYSDRDEFFDPPYSTFEPTRKEENQQNVNTVPGRDVIYFDCRVLPKYSLDNIINDALKLKELFENTYYAVLDDKKINVKIDVEVVARSDAPPPTSPNSEIIVKLKRAIKIARGIDAKVGGIGGGTYAAIFRRKGIPAAVWATVDETAHNPNEYARVSNIVEDAKVFALLVFL